MAGNPAGDNGTVKIDGVVFDEAPDNQPHVGCVFQVDFYGFDKGMLKEAAGHLTEERAAGPRATVAHSRNSDFRSPNLLRRA